MHFSLFTALPLLGLAVAGPLDRRAPAATTGCDRDNVFRCILGTPAVGSPYCSSVLSYGTKTSYTSTFTPTMTATASATDSETTTVTTATTTSTTLTDSFFVTSTETDTSITSTTTTTTTTTTSTVIPPLMEKRDDSLINERGGAVRIYSEIYGSGSLPRNIEARVTGAPAPSCLAQYSPAPSRVTSACSCLTSSLAITSPTIYTVSTAPAVTVTITNTVSTTQTNTVSSSETDTVTTSITDTIPATITVPSTTSTTTTSTFVSTVTQNCADCYLCTSSSQCQAGFECATYYGFSFGQVSLCSNITPGAPDYTCGAICTN